MFVCATQDESIDELGFNNNGYEQEIINEKMEQVSINNINGQQTMGQRVLALGRRAQMEKRQQFRVGVG